MILTYIERFWYQNDEARLALSAIGLFCEMSNGHLIENGWVAEPENVIQCHQS